MSNVKYRRWCSHLTECTLQLVASCLVFLVLSFLVSVHSFVGPLVTLGWFFSLSGSLFCVASWFLDVLSLLSWFIGQALHWSSFCDYLDFHFHFCTSQYLSKVVIELVLSSPHCFCFVTLLMWVAYVGPSDIFSFALLHYSYKMWYMINVDVTFYNVKFVKG